MTVVPPSWEVLDEEARARDMNISVEVYDGQTYVCYKNTEVDGMFLDHPVGRQGAQEMFNNLSEKEGQ